MRKVLIIGVGGIGSYLAPVLDKTGLYDITIADPDDLEDKNFLYQNYSKPKFLLQENKKKVAQLDMLKANKVGFPILTQQQLMGFDLIVCCADNLDVRRLVYRQGFQEDCKNKCYTNVGLYITWLKENDKVEYIEYPREWCAGATAIHLSCQESADEIYMLGFDLSKYNEPINNIYKGTDNYLSETSKGFNVDNWTKQLIQTFKDFPETQFYWVVDSEKESLDCNNVKSITYKDLDKRCQI